MSDDLRRSLSHLTTTELADIIARHDLGEWHPAVFPIAEAILEERGMLPPEPASDSPHQESDESAALSQKLVGLQLPGVDVHSSLSRLPTRKLVAIVGRHDGEQWRPEVFGVAESILRERGVRPPAPAVRRPARTLRDEVATTDDLVRLVELPTPSLVLVVKSLLAPGRFRFLITNEEAQGLFAVGQVGVGYNPITGPPSLFVEQSRLAEARELLAPLFEHGAALPESLAGEEPSSWGRRTTG
jgi:hypothetical protein